MKYVYIAVLLLAAGAIFVLSTRQRSAAGGQYSHGGFAFHGKPVQPAIVKFFRCWMSDSPDQGPRIAAVNLSSCVASNWYPAPVKADGNGWLSYNYGKHGSESFAYRYIGVTPTHTYVLETADDEGGSGDFETLFLMRFGTMAYYVERSNNTGVRKPTQVPTLACIGQIDMGDRDPASVTLRGNVLTLGKSGYRGRAVNMRIP